MKHLIQEHADALATMVEGDGGMSKNDPHGRTHGDAHRIAIGKAAARNTHHALHDRFIVRGVNYMLELTG